LKLFISSPQESLVQIVAGLTGSNLKVETLGPDALKDKELAAKHPSLSTPYL